VTIYGDAERPRVLVHGLDDSHEAAAVIERLAGRVKYLDAWDRTLRWASWDALVTIGSFDLDTADTDHLRVFQAGGIPVGNSNPVTFTHPEALDAVTIVGEEVQIGENLAKNLRELVKRELVPAVLGSSPPREGFLNHKLGVRFTPLLTDLDGRAIAAIYQPVRGLHECWYVPEVVPDLGVWLEAAFAEWSRDLPEVFPTTPDWVDNEQWMTAEEVAADESHRLLEQNAQETFARLEAEIQESAAERAALRQRVDAEERLLLTETGDGLVVQVAAALERLGFEVEDVDAAGRREKREDLRVRDGDWIALCEVKGHDKGATTADILKASRFTALYVQTEQKLPDATWYVVNQFRGTNPSVRRVVLRGQDDDVNAFAEQNGLVVDTRQLFVLDQAVLRRSVEPQAARELLKTSVGRFEFLPGIGRP
jgi:hypothetical protein